MKKNLTFLFAMLLSMVSIKSFAHDIAVANSDGKTIYYIYTNNNTELAVSYRGSSSSSYSNEYSGDVAIPESVTYNGTVYSVTSIGEHAFYQCTGLTSITIPNSVKSIGYGAFFWCTGLTSITIPNSVTSITDHAFSGCTGLTSITIPNSVMSIGYYAFWCCSCLTSITIPNSVTSIGGWAFQSCSGLTSIVVEDGNPNYDSRYNCNAIIETSSNTLLFGCMNTTIPNSVTSIGDYAFCKCTGLTSITIPNSVTCIGDEAFAWCSGLTSMVVEAGNSKFDSRNNCNALIETSSNTLIAGCMNTTIPNSVTSIGNYAFAGCSGLTSITIPNSVASIGQGAFDYCTALTSVTIPNSVTSIGSSAFSETVWYNNQPDGLVYAGKVAYQYKGDMPENTKITLNEGTLGIADCAFGGCSGLTSISIPNSVTSIGGSAFQGCSGLTSITIPNSVITIGDRAFEECTGLTSITIPNSVKSIGDYAFAYCTGLTTITIGNSVTSIRDGAFYGCSSLTSITIPNSVTSIGNAAFFECTGLTSIMSEIQDPFEIAEDVFRGTYDSQTLIYEKATLMVPAGTKSKYEVTNYWNLFANIVEMDLTPVNGGETVDFGDDIDDDTNLDGNIVGDIYFNISSDDGGYNSAEGCIVVSKPTDDTSIGEGQDIFDEDFRDNFTGIVFKVPAGTGTIKVEAQTTGGMVLKVKIGNSEPVSMELDGKQKASFPYDVTEPTFVYIYGGSNASSAPDMLGAPAATGGELKLYGIEVDANATGISNVNVNDNDNNNERWYSLDGQQLQSKPTQKGVYIHNGKKLLIK